MTKTILAALAITLGAGANVALAEGSPELNRPFGWQRLYSAPQAAAVVPAPVASDADAYSRLQADGYRAINVVRGNDGAWHGTAIRGAAKVGVTVDPQGRVFAQ
jgi:hypothetical protein